MFLKLEELNRGGLLVSGAGIRMQVGAYPETIKDTMLLGEGVPDLYLLPDLLFDTEAGVSAAELEFPLYFNFYVQRRKLRLICRRNQVRRILRVLCEALFGPRRLYLEQEFPEGRHAPDFPDLELEMSFFKKDPDYGQLRLKHFLDVLTFDELDQVRVDGTLLTRLAPNSYRFEKDGQSQEIVFGYRSARPQSEAEAPGPLWKPPVFGVTVIGSGHGFDAATSTSGFILWMDQKGVMVDPPVNSTAWMRANGINNRLIQDVVLTHCHADHDSGTMQKLLEEGRVRLHSTETVMQSFLTKYSALTGLTRGELSSLFAFRPVIIGQPFRIAGAMFTFHYTFHPIPTLGFKVEYQGKGFAYSCDTLYDPVRLADLHQEGYLSEARKRTLLDFPWHLDVLFHEAGVPPIHTPLEVLADLPEEVKSRLYLVHVSESSIPPDQGLRLAPPGPEHTIVVPVDPPNTSMAQKMLDVLAHIDMFRSMPLERAHEFMQITHYLELPAGTTIFRKGERGDRFYMVMSGEVEIIPDQQHRYIFGRYDYFGERALILQEGRAADLVTRTPVELLWMERRDFLAFIRDTDLPSMFRRLAENRVLGSWELFDANRVLRQMTALQKNQLTILLKHEEAAAGSWLFKPNDPVTRYFLVDQGCVRVTTPDGESLMVGRGGLVGEPDRFLHVERHRFGARAEERCQLYHIARADLARFFRENPGTQVRLLDMIQGVRYQPRRKEPRGGFLGSGQSRAGPAPSPAKA
ncbi:MAG: hypothetical protein AMXMBFR33_45170 [Candidatus Xenobia bacterium]